MLKKYLLQIENQKDTKVTREYLNLLVIRYFRRSKFLLYLELYFYINSFLRFLGTYFVIVDVEVNALSRMVLISDVTGNVNFNSSENKDKVYCIFLPYSSSYFYIYNLIEYTYVRFSWFCKNLSSSVFSFESLMVSQSGEYCDREYNLCTDQMFLREYKLCLTEMDLLSGALIYFFYNVGVLMLILRFIQKVKNIIKLQIMQTREVHLGTLKSKMILSVDL
jgi:hypothetical protein